MGYARVSHSGPGRALDPHRKLFRLPSSPEIEALADPFLPRTTKPPYPANRRASFVGHKTRVRAIRAGSCLFSPVRLLLEVLSAPAHACMRSQARFLSRPPPWFHLLSFRPLLQPRTCCCLFFPGRLHRGLGYCRKPAQPRTPFALEHTPSCSLLALESERSKQTRRTFFSA